VLNGVPIPPWVFVWPIEKYGEVWDLRRGRRVSFAKGAEALSLRTFLAVLVQVY